MIKRIETFLANIFRREIAPVKNDLAAALAAITKLRGELAEMHQRFEETKTHTESVASGLYEDVRNHAVEVAANLHAKVADDAKAILKFQQTARLSCSWCGQLSRTYVIEKTTGKVACADCQQKGRGI